MNDKSTRQISLPEDLCHLAEQRYAERFRNIEECLEFVLQSLLNQHSGQMDRAEEQLIERRLRDLGYIQATNPSVTSAV